MLKIADGVDEPIPTLPLNTDVPVSVKLPLRNVSPMNVLPETVTEFKKLVSPLKLLVPLKLLIPVKLFLPVKLFMPERLVVPKTDKEGADIL